MVVFFWLLAIICAISLVVFTPVICQYIFLRRTERQLLKQISELNIFYEDKVQIVLRPLGLGPSQNSDVKFSDAHKNQKFAVNSILYLIDELGG